MSTPEEVADYYQLLGIIRTANPDQIQSAFHRFARLHHPDNFAGSSEGVDEHTLLYQLGSEAYRVLIDPTKRKLYDEGLAKGIVRYEENRATERRHTMRAPGGVALMSGKARMFYMRAYHAMKLEDWPQAKLNLKMAIQNEPENAELQAKLEEVQEHMKSR